MVHIMVNALGKKHGAISITIILTIFPLTPVCLLRSLAKLRYATLGSVFSLFVVCITIQIEWISQQNHAMLAMFGIFSFTIFGQYFGISGPVWVRLLRFDARFEFGSSRSTYWYGLTPKIRYVRKNRYFLDIHFLRYPFVSYGITHIPENEHNFGHDFAPSASFELKLGPSES